MILVGTNVVSEFMRDSPDPTVLAWAREQPASALALTAVMVQEIEYGIGRLPAGRRRSDLARRWATVLAPFEELIEPYTAESATRAAGVLIERERLGTPISLPDAQIAGIALALGADLATRNVADFRDIPGLRVIDPFNRNPE